MLSRMGKWLRAAGYDTLLLKEPISDREVLALALKDNRILITRDRHFLQMKQASPILCYLKNNDFESCIEELNLKLKIDWLFAPFSRCMICNSPLEKVILDHLLEQIPEAIRKKKNTFWHCPSCSRFYWEGTHTARMLKQLEKWGRS